MELGRHRRPDRAGADDDRARRRRPPAQRRARPAARRRPRPARAAPLARGARGLHGRRGAAHVGSRAMHRPSAVLATVLFTFAITATASANSYCVAARDRLRQHRDLALDALTRRRSIPATTASAWAPRPTPRTGCLQPGRSRARVDHRRGPGRRRRSGPAMPSPSTADHTVGLQGRSTSPLHRLTGTTGPTSRIRLQYGGQLDRLASPPGHGRDQPTGMEAGRIAITNSRFASRHGAAWQRSARAR